MALVRAPIFLECEILLGCRALRRAESKNHPIDPIHACMPEASNPTTNPSAGVRACKQPCPSCVCMCMVGWAARVCCHVVAGARRWPVAGARAAGAQAGRKRRSYSY